MAVDVSQVLGALSMLGQSNQLDAQRTIDAARRRGGAFAQYGQLAGMVGGGVLGAGAGGVGAVPGAMIGGTVGSAAGGMLGGGMGGPTTPEVANMGLQAWGAYQTGLQQKSMGTVGSSWAKQNLQDVQNQQADLAKQHGSLSDYIDQQRNVGGEHETFEETPEGAQAVSAQGMLAQKYSQLGQRAGMLTAMTDPSVAAHLNPAFLGELMRPQITTAAPGAGIYATSPLSGTQQVGGSTGPLYRDMTPEEFHKRFPGAPEEMRNQYQVFTPTNEVHTISGGYLNSPQMMWSYIMANRNSTDPVKRATASMYSSLLSKPTIGQTPTGLGWIPGGDVTTALKELDNQALPASGGTTGSPAPGATTAAQAAAGAARTSTPVQRDLSSEERSAFIKQARGIQQYKEFASRLGQYPAGTLMSGIQNTAQDLPFGVGEMLTSDAFRKNSAAAGSFISTLHDTFQRLGIQDVTFAKEGGMVPNINYSDARNRAILQTYQPLMEADLRMQYAQAKAQHVAPAILQEMGNELQNAGVDPNSVTNKDLVKPFAGMKGRDVEKLAPGTYKHPLALTQAEYDKEPQKYKGLRLNVDGQIGWGR